MADFKAHTGLGMLWGGFMAAAALFSGICSPAGCVVAFFLACAGSAAPDVDSDTGRPREIVLSFAGIMTVAVLVLYFYEDLTTEMLLAMVLTAFFAARYLGELIFALSTRHRGVWHSIPMAVLSGELTWLVFFDIPSAKRWIYALALSGGFLSHLMLDEMCSFKFFGLIPKRSSGSACKFSAGSKVQTFLIYFLILICGVCCFFI